MSLKAIEMQVALPRTFDAAKQADQHNVHNHLAQSAAGIELEKELRKKRHTATEIEHKGEAGLHRGKHQGNEQIETKQPTDSTAVEIKVRSHPYKGKKIDYSG
jgi:hypothetical protein